MAMTAWAAKFVTSSICLSVNGSNLLAINDDHADGSSLLQQRHAKQRAQLPQVSTSSRQVVFRIGMHIGNVDGLPS